ncbi:MAG: helix-turn-helix transcriptional regulator [Bacteroidia bacterium]|nr:helix-turn-helix transcriptional regulator [Bacteroidia bacterium]
MRELRKRKYPSYEQFANEHDLSRVQIGRFENGANMTMANFIKVLHALNISLKDFFAEGFGED